MSIMSKYSRFFWLELISDSEVGMGMGVNLL